MWQAPKRLWQPVLQLPAKAQQQQLSAAQIAQLLGKGGGKARFSTAFTSDRRTHPTTRAAEEPSAAPSIPERPDE